MPSGRLVRRDNIHTESMGVEGRVDCDRGMLEALTSESGPLPSGALPEVVGASEAGARKMFQALGESVEKRKQPKKSKPESKNSEKGEPMEPKTPLQPKAQFQSGTRDAVELENPSWRLRSLKRATPETFASLRNTGEPVWRPPFWNHL